LTFKKNNYKRLANLIEIFVLNLIISLFWGMNSVRGNFNSVCYNQAIEKWIVWIWNVKWNIWCKIIKDWIWYLQIVQEPNGKYWNQIILPLICWTKKHHYTNENLKIFIHPSIPSSKFRESLLKFFRKLPWIAQIFSHDLMNYANWKLNLDKCEWNSFPQGRPLAE